LTSENSSLHSYPLLHYYYAYLNEDLGEKEMAGTFYESAASLSTDYVFPFRFETLEILDAAIRHNPGDAKAWYYKGNILYDHQPEEAIKCWKRSISLDPKLSIAQRNLGWAHYRHSGEIGEAIDYYEKAISNNPLEARYYYELDLLYEKYNTDLAKRYQMLTENHETVIYRDDAYVREIEVLLLNKQYDKAIEHLSSHTFQRQEGVVNLHGLFVDAHILKGRELLTDGLYDQALEQFFQADTYPENHMIGRISTYPKEAQIYYFTGMAYQGLKKNSYATRFFAEAVQVPVGDSENLYYRSLAGGELNDRIAAEGAANRLLKVGGDALNSAGEADFFAKFGEGLSVNERKANAYYKMALGYKASGQSEKAAEAFDNALKLKNSILWANVYFD